MNRLYLITKAVPIEGICKSMYGWYVLAIKYTFLSIYFTTLSFNYKIKRTLPIVFFILFSLPNLYSQNIDKPTVHSQSNYYATISFVEITNNETIVALSIDYNYVKSFKIGNTTSLTTNTGSNFPLIKFTCGNGWLKFDTKINMSKKNHNIYLYFDKISPTTSSIDIIENKEGGHYWRGISLKKASPPKTSTHISSSSNIKSTSSSDVGYNSTQQIRNYLASNIAKLDPIEGEYDVQMGFKTNSPFVADDNDYSNLFVVKNSLTKDFSIYAEVDGELLKASNPKIESIGTTNAYRIFYGNSSARAILENNIRFRTDISLSPKDAQEFAENPSFKYNIIVTYDFVKKYPTSSMYANAYRKKFEEETKPSLWTGTGFALTNNYIVTNYHVIEEAKSIYIQGINGNFKAKYCATVFAIDKINDLAILKVDEIKINTASIPYSIKTTTSDVGEDVFVLGYPLTSTMGDEIKLTTGVVSSRTGFQGDVSLYQISAPIQPGNSGGPLFDSKGNIIGIVSAKHRGAENVGYAIKASYLRNLMESSMSTNILPQNNKIAGLNLSGKVKSVKNFVFYITCSR